MQQQMQYHVQHKKPFIAYWDWVLIIGLTLAPMTDLRIWKIGPGEGLVVIWCMRFIYKVFSEPFNNLFSRFWLVFLPIIALGSGFCMLFYPAEGSFSDLMTYLFFFAVTSGILAGLKEKSAREIKNILYTLGIVASFWFMFLYVYSKTVSTTIWGARIWYYRTRFTGGANNPHQVAVLISAVFFLNIIQIIDPVSKLPWKIVSFASCVFCFVIASATKSSTLIVAVVSTTLVFFYYMAINRISTKSGRWIATSVLIIIFALLIGLFWEKLLEMLMEWIESDANGVGRFEIFESITDMLRKNWLFGLGPGTHGLDGTIEFHNAYLEILAMGGVLGLGIFILFSVRLFSVLMVEPPVFFCVVPIYAYGMGGFAMRRLVFWGVSAIVVAYAMQLRREKQLSEGASGKETNERKKAFLLSRMRSHET